MLPSFAQNVEKSNLLSDNSEGASPVISSQINIAGDVHAAGDFVSGNKIIEGNDIHDNQVVNVFVTTGLPLPKTPSPLLTAEITRQSFEPETILIPAATFWMGSDEGAAHEAPRHQVTLPAYRIGKALVTNAEYAIFIAQCEGAVPAELGWDGQQPAKEQCNRPVTGVTFFDALRYCKWLASQTDRPYGLPHEAAWEGASLLESFSWGNAREWTFTLWGESLLLPDEAYRYPWQNDERRNALNAGRHLRRVIRGETRTRASSRRSESPDQPGAPGKRLGFRIYLPIKGSHP